MILTREPNIDTRQKRQTIGIRTRTPMIGMFKVVEALKKEIRLRMESNEIQPAGPSFLRYHVIDMEGEMDIEVGFPVDRILHLNGRIRSGVLPAGRYANLVYVGHGLTGNKALIEWMGENHLAVDRWEDPRGDAFRCRTETYLTDPILQPKKMKWEIEVAIKLLG